jgi:hypothetical protein
MMQITPSHEPFHCPHCGALYEMASEKVPGYDEGSACCTVCRKKMKSWSGHRVFWFRLLKHLIKIRNLKQEFLL